MSFIRKNIVLAREFLKMKPIHTKVFNLLLDNKLYWSKAYQSLTKSAQNLLFCMFAELRFTGKRGSKSKPFSYINNKRLSFSESEFRKQGLGASGTYISARNQLIRVGFIRVTYRGGMARGDMNTYELLINSELAPQSKQRWRRYPDQNWEHEIPKVKNYAVGKKTRFKKKNNTLKNKTLNGTNLPKALTPSKETSLLNRGVTDDFNQLRP